MRLSKNKSRSRYVFYNEENTGYEGYFNTISNICYCIKSVDVGYSKWEFSKAFYI